MLNDFIKSPYNSIKITHHSHNYCFVYSTGHQGMAGAKETGASTLVLQDTHYPSLSVSIDVENKKNAKVNYSSRKIYLLSS